VNVHGRRHAGVFQKLQGIQPTSLLTQSIGEGRDKQVRAEEGSWVSPVIASVRCRFSWDTERDAGGER